MQSCQSEMAVSVLKKRLPLYERFKRTLILTEWCKTCTHYQGGPFFKKDSSLQTNKKTAFSWLMCRKIDTGLMLHKEQLVQKRKKFAHFVLPCSLSWQRQFSLHMLWYVCVDSVCVAVCVCGCVLSVDRCHKTPSYLLTCLWHRSAQCSSVCVCMLSVLTEDSTVFLSVYMLHVCVVCWQRSAQCSCPQAASSTLLNTWVRKRQSGVCRATWPTWRMTHDSSPTLDSR